MDTRTSRGRIIVFVIVCVVMLVDVTLGLRLPRGQREAGDLGDTVRFALTVLLMLFLYRGHAWAKWFTVVGMLLVVVLAVFGLLRSSELTSWRLSLTGLGVLYGAAGVTLLISPSVAAFMRYQRRVLASRKPQADVSEGDAEQSGRPADADARNAGDSREFWVMLLLLSLGLVIYGIAISSTIEGQDVAGKLGERTGHALGVGLLSCLVWRYVFHRRKGAGVLCFAVIFSVMVYHATLVAIREADPARRVARELASLLRDAMDDANIGEEKPDTRTYGELAPLVTFFRAYCLRMRKDSADMAREMGEQQIDTMLDPAALGELSKIEQARARLEKARLVLEKYETLFQQRVREARQELSDLDLPDDAKAGVCAGFNRSALRQQSRISEFFRIERSFVSELDKTLEFLSKRQGKYWFENGQIVFGSQADAGTFNKHMDRIARLAEEEDAWHAKVKQHGSEIIGELEELGE